MRVRFYLKQWQWGLTFSDRVTGVFLILDVGPLELVVRRIGR